MNPKRLPISASLEFGRRSRVAIAPTKLGIVAAAQKISSNVCRETAATVARISTVVRHIRPDLIYLNNSIHASGRALKLLTRQNWQCLTVGDLPTENANRAYYSHVRDLVTTLGLENRVHFTGYRSDVVRMVAAFDVMLHSSVAPEPPGPVILEVNSLGKVPLRT